MKEITYVGAIIFVVTECIHNHLNIHNQIKRFISVVLHDKDLEKTN